MSLNLTGIHHLTAITAQAQQNKQFYTGLLGMRLVKKTVNQDDTSAYHLFYADGQATPGSDLTFFDWPAASEKRGTHSISRTGLRVAGEESLDYWQNRLQQASVSMKDIQLIDGRASLDFEDFEGQRFRLLDDEGAGLSHPWDKSTVPAQHQIRGLGPITISVPDLKYTEPFLVQLMNMRKSRDYISPDGHGHVHVYEMGDGGPAAELHVAVQPDLPAARQGAGGVHHVAFRTPDQDSMHEWLHVLNEHNVHSSGEVDRFYFRSLYFREGNGILFEIATDGPGFATDEPMENLGESLSLPPFLENKRTVIERGLKPLD